MLAGDEGPVGKHNLADAGIDGLVLELAQSRLAEAIGRVDHLEARAGVLAREARQRVVAAPRLARRDRAAVQHAEMRAVELAFKTLEPVAVHQGAADDRMRRRTMELEIEEFGRGGAAAEIDPHQPAGLARRVVMHRHAGGELGAAVGRLGRGVHHLARHVDLPAVEDAAQPVALVARQRQRGAAMRAALVEEADAAVGGAEGDEILSEQAHPARRAVALEAGRAQRRGPELAQHLAHRRARPDPRQQPSPSACVAPSCSSPRVGGIMLGVSASFDYGPSPGSGPPLRMRGGVQRAAS